jgi:hypothetical protein
MQRHHHVTKPKIPPMQITALKINKRCRNKRLLSKHEANRLKSPKLPIIFLFQIS